MAGERAGRMRAFAKINLMLRVLGVRADGYHDLRTIFQSIGLHDTLTFVRASGPLRIECDDPACPVDRTNLVWRAADEVWRVAGRRGVPRDVLVRIAKRIPVQAGLGGGSSDAATTLRALARWWRVDAAGGKLDGIARRLGADVPFFLTGGTVLGLERGDLLFPLADIPSAWVALVIPPFRVSTGEAFAWWDGSDEALTNRRLDDVPAGVHSARGHARQAQTNDLEAAVRRRHPEIPRLVRALRRHGAWHTAMSGSGSAVFGLFGHRRAAERAARDLNGVVTRTVNRTQYQRLAGIAGHRIDLPFAPRGSGHS